MHAGTRYSDIFVQYCVVVYRIVKRAPMRDRIGLACVQHSAVRQVSCARDVHPEYADAVAAALQAGVEVLAYAADVSPTQIELGDRLPFSVD